MATKHEVLILHNKYPKLTAGHIASLLACGDGYVRATAQRCELDLPKAHKKVDLAVTKERINQYEKAEKYVKSEQFQIDTKRASGPSLP